MELKKLTVDDVDFNGKKVIMRVDYNVPLKKNDSNGDGYIVMSDKRIVETIPTIQKIIEKGAIRIVLISHMGRPKTQESIYSKFSLFPVVKVLKRLLKKDVGFVTNYDVKDIETAANKIPGSECKIILMENVRFFPEEEMEDSLYLERSNRDKIAKFAAKLTSFGDIYVNDAFGACHRDHASITKIKLEQKVAGLLIKKELEIFSKLFSNNVISPFVAIVGGAKVSSKIKVIEKLLERVQILIIGGGMSYTFKKVISNMPIGNSIYEESQSENVHKIMKIASDRNIKIYLPEDFIISEKCSDSPDISTKEVKDTEGIIDDWVGVDIGSKTIEKFSSVLSEAKMVLWNGPLGVFEYQKFSRGTLKIMEKLQELTEKGVITVIGGGETASAAQKWNMTKFTHISTGGGALLELIEGKTLPGIKSLTDLS